MSEADKVKRKKKNKVKGKDDFKTFLGNKKEGQGFADKRKRKATYEYMKLLKKEKQEHLREGKEPAKHRPLAFIKQQQGKAGHQKRGHAFTTSQKIAKKKEEEKHQKKLEATKLRQEKDGAMKAYKSRKQEQYLKMCKRTSKGQPVMRHQMEVLLEKIKKQKGGNS